MASEASGDSARCVLTAMQVQADNCRGTSQLFAASPSNQSVFFMQRLSDRLQRCNFKGPGFDRIRLLAATTVIFHHCSTYATDDISNDVLYRISGGLVNFGHLAVYVFFATSGALVVPNLIRTGDLTAFVVNRVVRIMPALVCVVLVTALLVGPALTSLTVREYFNDDGFYRYFNNIIFRAESYLPGVTTPAGQEIVVNGSLWTIYFEVWCYIALLLLFIVGALRKINIAIWLFFLIYILNASIWVTDEFAGTFPQRLVTFFDLFVYFLAGACLIIASSKVIYHPAVAILAIISLAISFPLGAGVFTLPIALPYLVLYVGYSKMLGANPLRSDYSYGVYLSHAVVLAILLSAFPGISNFFIATSIVLVAAFLVAYASWRFIEEPCLRQKRLASELAGRGVSLLFHNAELKDGNRLPGKPDA